MIAVKPGVSLSESQLRQAMAGVDLNLPILYVRTMREEISGQLTQQLLTARLTSLFGILALVLCCIGIYGVTAYNAGRRTSEMGIRMALGASRMDIVLLVIYGALGLVVVGLLIGLPLGLAASGFLGHQLYGLNPYNPAVMLVAAGGLAVRADRFARSGVASEFRRAKRSVACWVVAIIQSADKPQDRCVPHEATDIEIGGYRAFGRKFSSHGRGENARTWWQGRQAALLRSSE